MNARFVGLIGAVSAGLCASCGEKEQAAPARAPEAVRPPAAEDDGLAVAVGPVVAVAVETGRPEHYLAAGVLFRNEDNRDSPSVGIAFLVPPDLPVWHAYVWAGPEPGRRWFDMDDPGNPRPDGIALGSIFNFPFDGFDLDSAGELPGAAEVSELLVPEWVELPETRRRRGRDDRSDEEKAAAAAFVARYVAHLDELAAFENRFRYVSPLSRERVNDLTDEDLAKIDAMVAQQEEMEREADEKGIDLPHWGGRAWAPGPPDTGAGIRRVETRVEVASPVAGAERVPVFAPATVGSDAPPANAVAEGRFLLRGFGGATEVLGFDELARVFAEPAGDITASFVNAGDPWEFHLAVAWRFDQRLTGRPLSAIRVTLPGGEPIPLEHPVAGAEGRFDRDSNEVRFACYFPPESFPPDTELEAVATVVVPPTGDVVESQPVRFSISLEDGGRPFGEMVRSDRVRWDIVGE